jgi:hypothetical protein
MIALRNSVTVQQEHLLEERQSALDTARRDLAQSHAALDAEKQSARELQDKLDVRYR